jgi:hypothetical protein
MALIEINHHPSRRELRQFAGIWFPAMMAFIGWLVWSKADFPAIAIIVWSIGAVVSVVGWFDPAFMRLIYVGWMYAAFPIGWTVSHLLLAVIFYLILTPIGLVARLCGRDRLNMKWNRSLPSYWVPHATVTDPKRYFRQF